jgi:RIO-like serine/threonine protein kinase
MRLNDIQGKGVAKMLGHFKVVVFDREFDVLVLDYINCDRLDKVKSATFSPNERKNIRDSIIDTVKHVYSKNIFFPNIFASNFFVERDSHCLYISGFSSTVGPSTHSLAREETHTRAARDVATVERIIDQWGY